MGWVMNLERAAQALVECGYAGKGFSYHGPNFVLDKHNNPIEVDPLNNEAQRQALLEWYRIEVWIGKNGLWVSDSVHSDATILDQEKRLEAENACLEEILK